MQKIMAITNLTPDSFYSGSRCMVRKSGNHYENALMKRITEQLAQGADIIDLGACSTRPGADRPSPEEEWDRLAPALEAICRHFPDVPLSIDTYRPNVVSRAFDLLKRPFVLNDVSGGASDRLPYLAGALGLPWCAMYDGPNNPDLSDDALLASVTEAFDRFLELARTAHIPEVWLDPGFGFGKTMEQNYKLIRLLPQLPFQHHPLLCGISRKRMCYQPFELTPETCLPETTALHLQLWLGGTDILRVHDVPEAVHTRQMAIQLSHNIL